MSHNAQGLLQKKKILLAFLTLVFGLEVLFVISNKSENTF